MRRALVVGAGIGGLTTAVGLARAGWDVEVADRGAAVDRRGAALGLWPHAWQGLRELGVTDLLDDASDYTRASVRSPDGRVLGHLPLGAIRRRHGEPVRLVTRPALMQALVTVHGQANDRPIRFGTTVAADRDAAGYDLVVGGA